ncbi:hypothetical protein HHI36_009537 [Cryptolaemus montrouzieri]|uniref:Uncharacterized protein n=1 Tax=Cryptolaemus montrouzieri TaxID=559131 RepID=A0ABD2MG04_9CUCU
MLQTAYILDPIEKVVSSAKRVPRKYRKQLGSSSYNNYSKDKLEEDLTKVSYFKILRTLPNKVKGKHPKAARGQIVFTKKGEEIIITADMWKLRISNTGITKHFSID